MKSIFIVFTHTIIHANEYNEFYEKFIKNVYLIDFK